MGNSFSQDALADSDDEVWLNLSTKELYDINFLFQKCANILIFDHQDTCDSSHVATKEESLDQDHSIDDSEFIDLYTTNYAADISSDAYPIDANMLWQRLVKSKPATYAHTDMVYAMFTANRESDETCRSESLEFCLRVRAVLRIHLAIARVGTQLSGRRGKSGDSGTAFSSVFLPNSSWSSQPVQNPTHHDEMLAMNLALSVAIIEGLEESAVFDGVIRGAFNSILALLSSMAPTDSCSPPVDKVQGYCPNSGMCPHHHVMESYRNEVPRSYLEIYSPVRGRPTDVIVECDECGRAGLGNNDDEFLHCDECSYDLCENCSGLQSAARNNGSTPSPDAVDTIGSTAGRGDVVSTQRTRSTLVNGGPASEALEKLVHMCRKQLARESQATVNSSTTVHSRFHGITSCQNAFTDSVAVYRRRRDRRCLDSSQALTQAEADLVMQRSVSIPDIALSFMLAVGVMRESLSAVLEVVFVLTAPPGPIRLRIVPAASNFVRRLMSLRAGHGSDDSSVLRKMNAFYQPSSSPTASGLALDAAHMIWESDASLDSSDRQAIAILTAVSEITMSPKVLSAGSDRWGFAIEDDVYFELLLNMAEKAAITLSRCNDKEGVQLLRQNDIRRAVYLGVAALRIILNNLRVLSHQDNSLTRRLDLASLDTDNDVCAISYKERILDLLTTVTSNSKRSLGSDLRGMVATIVTDFVDIYDALIPDVTDQFSLACGLLVSTLAEQRFMNSEVYKSCELAVAMKILQTLKSEKLVSLVQFSFRSGCDGIITLLQSFLHIAESALHNRLMLASCHSVQNAADSTEEGSFVTELYRVLQSLVVHGLSVHATFVTDENDPEFRDRNVASAIRIVNLLLQSATSTLEHLMSLVNADACGNYFASYDAEILRSHIPFLLPFAFLSLSLLFPTLSVDCLQKSGLDDISSRFSTLIEVLGHVASSKWFPPAIGLHSHLSYRETKLSPKKIPGGGVCVTKWDIALSDSYLQFSDGDKSCRRPGNGSCYPAAFAPVPNEGAACSYMHVKIMEAATETNWLTIGVCKVGFTTSGTDGFGRSPDSWGIACDRSQAEVSFVATNGQKLFDCPRKLVVGDSVVLKLDLSAGTIEFRVISKTGLTLFNFTTPPDAQLKSASPQAFWFGATFANDHCLRIVSDATLSDTGIAAYDSPKTALHWVHLLAKGVRDMQLALLKRILGSPSAAAVVKSSADLTSPTSENARPENILNGRTSEESEEDHSDENTGHFSDEDDVRASDESSYFSHCDYDSEDSNDASIRIVDVPSTDLLIPQISLSAVVPKYSDANGRKSQAARAWLALPLFSGGLMNVAELMQGDGGCDMHVSACLALLRQLASPNLSDDAKMFISFMKRFVREDQGSDAYLNRIAYSVASAMMWHEGFAVEVAFILRELRESPSKLREENFAPSPHLQAIWRLGQSVRRVDKFILPDANDDEQMRRESQGGEMNSLNFASSLAVGVSVPMMKDTLRRIAWLLDFTPVIRVSSDNTAVLSLTSESWKGAGEHLTVADIILQFALHGPDIASLKEELEVSRVAAAQRLRALSLSEELLTCDPALVMHIEDRTKIIAALADTIHSQSMVSDLQELTAVPRVADLRLSTLMEASLAAAHRSHFLSSGLGGCSVSRIREKWFAVVRLVCRMAERCLGEQPSSKSSCESALLAALSILSIVYQDEDLRYVESSGLVPFLVKCLRSHFRPVRRAARITLESLSHLCCSVAARSIAAKRQLLLLATSPALVTVAEARMIHRKIVTGFSTEMVFASAIEGFDLQRNADICVPTTDCVTLLDGPAVCNANEEGLSLFMSAAARIVPAQSVAPMGSGHSLSLWLFCPRGCISGSVLTRFHGSVDQWSFFSLGLRAGRICILIGSMSTFDDGTKEDTSDRQLVLSSEAEVLSQEWNHIVFVADPINGFAFLYLNGIRTEAALPNDMAASSFPYPEIVLPTSQARAELKEWPFIIGQVHAPLSGCVEPAASGCVLACVLVHLSALSQSAVLRTAIEVAPGPSSGPLQSRNGATKEAASDLIPDLEFSVTGNPLDHGGRHSGVRCRCVSRRGQSAQSSSSRVLHSRVVLKTEASMMLRLNSGDFSERFFVGVGKGSVDDAPENFLIENFSGVRNADDGQGGLRLEFVRKRNGMTAVEILLMDPRKMKSGDFVTVDVNKDTDVVSIAVCNKGTNLERNLPSLKQTFTDVGFMDDEWHSWRFVAFISPHEIVELLNVDVSALSSVVAAAEEAYDAVQAWTLRPNSDTEASATMTSHHFGSSKHSQVATCRLRAPKSSLFVRIDHCNELSSGVLSIGFARITSGLEDVLSSPCFLEGLGLGIASWGVCEQFPRRLRDSDPLPASLSFTDGGISGGIFIAGADGVGSRDFICANSRCFCVGDTVEILLNFSDINNCYAEISVNGGEIAHSCELQGSYEEYVFGATLPEGHELIIISSVPVRDEALELHSNFASETAGVTDSRVVSSWDMSLYASARENLGAPRTLSCAQRIIFSSKDEVVGIFACMSRIVREFLNIAAVEAIGDEVLPGDLAEFLLGPAGVLQPTLAVAMHSSSSSLRLAATKFLIQTLPLLLPADLDRLMITAKLIPREGNSGFAKHHSKFLVFAIEQLGNLLNPHGYLPPFHIACFKNVSISFFSDIFSALAASPRKYWWDLVRLAVEEASAAGRSAFDTLCHATSNGDSDDAALDHANGLLGILNICGGKLPGSLLLPGASFVQHTAYGSSIPENWSVISYGQLGSFGESVLIAPTTVSEFSPMSRKETVLVKCLQAEQKSADYRLSPAVLASVLSRPTSHTPTDDPALGRMHCLKLLLDVASWDTSDNRDLDIDDIRCDATEAPCEGKGRSLVMESLHPYRDNTDETYVISIPGAKELLITFDARSRTEANYDYLRFVRDSTLSTCWGQEKYSGSTWPGVDGIEPLRIRDSHCIVTFHSDGSNNDWGYRFTVVGIGVSPGFTSVLKPAFPALLLLRYAKAMAILSLQRIFGALMIGTSAQASHWLLFDQLMSSSGICQSLLNSILNHIVQSSINTFLQKRRKSQEIAAEGPTNPQSMTDHITVSLSSVPARSFASADAIIKTLRGINRVQYSNKVELPRSWDSPTSGHISTPLVLALIDSLDCDVSLSSKSDAMVNGSSAANDAAIVAPVPGALWSTTTTPASEFYQEDHHVPTNLIGGNDRPSKQYRLLCCSGTTHCRIRSGPSLKAPEVGDVANCSIVDVAGQVGAFYRLANGRGFVKIRVEGAISWIPLHEDGDPDSIFARSISSVRKASLLEKLCLHKFDEVVARTSYDFLCDLVAHSNLMVRSMDHHNLHLLIRMAGLGKLSNEKDASHRLSKKPLITPLLMSLKTAFQHKRTRREEIHESILKERDPPSPHVLIGLTSNLILRGLEVAKRQALTTEASSQSTAVVESDHEYSNNADTLDRVYLPDATGLEITFDSLCSTEYAYDHVCIYADREKKNMLAGKFSGRKSSGQKNWPGVGDQPSIIIEDRNEVWINFVSDGSNVDWGWRLTASALKLDSSPESRLSKDFTLRIRGGGKNSISKTTEDALSFNLKKISLDVGDGVLLPSMDLPIQVLQLLFDAYPFTIGSILFKDESGFKLIDALSQSIGFISHCLPSTAVNMCDIVANLLSAFASTELEQSSTMSIGLHSAMTSLAQNVQILFHLSHESRKDCISGLDAKPPGDATQPSPLMQSLAQAVVSAAIVEASLRVKAEAQMITLTSKRADSDALVVAAEESYETRRLAPGMIACAGGTGLLRKEECSNSTLGTGQAKDYSLGHALGWGPFFPQAIAIAPDVVALAKNTSLTDDSYLNAIGFMAGSKSVSVTSSSTSSKIKEGGNLLAAFKSMHMDASRADSSLEQKWRYTTNALQLLAKETDATISGEIVAAVNSDDATKDIGGPESSYTHYVKIQKLGRYDKLPFSIGIALIDPQATADTTTSAGLLGSFTCSVGWRVQREADNKWTAVLAFQEGEVSVVEDSISTFRGHGDGLGYQEGDIVGVTIRTLRSNRIRNVYDVARVSEPAVFVRRRLGLAAELEAEGRIGGGGDVHELELSRNGISVARMKIATMSGSVSAVGQLRLYAVAVNLPPGGEVLFLSSDEVPLFARGRLSIYSDNAFTVNSESSKTDYDPFSVETTGDSSDGNNNMPGPRTIPTTEDFEGTVLGDWDRPLCDSQLEFGPGVCGRGGSLSCFPCSMVLLRSHNRKNVTGPRMLEGSFAVTIRLQKAPLGMNVMSFGIAFVSFPVNGSEGFGHTRKSWGVSDNRQSHTSRTEIRADGELVGHFRKMREGDVFSIRYERFFGRAWLFINKSEFIHEFQLHVPRRNLPLVVGATYANNHTVSVLPVYPPPVPSTMMSRLLKVEAHATNAAVATVPAAPAAPAIPQRIRELATATAASVASENGGGVSGVDRFSPNRTYSDAVARFFGTRVAPRLAEMSISVNPAAGTESDPRARPPQSLSTGGGVIGERGSALVTCWDAAMSDSHLLFSPDKKSVSCTGSAGTSSYQAALVAIKDRSKVLTLSVVVLSRLIDGALSFGVAAAPFNHDTQSILGMRKDSWGLFHRGGSQSQFCACNSIIKCMRPLELGDQLTVTLDLRPLNDRNVGSAEVIVRGVDGLVVTNKFSLPLDLEYVVGATLSKDHILKLIDGPSGKIKVSLLLMEAQEDSLTMSGMMRRRERHLCPQIQKPASAEASKVAFKTPEYMEMRMRVTGNVTTFASRYYTNAREVAKKLIRHCRSATEQILSFNVDAAVGNLNANVGGQGRADSVILMRSLVSLHTFLHLLLGDGDDQSQPTEEFNMRDAGRHIPGNIVYCHIIPVCISRSTSIVSLTLPDAELRVCRDYPVVGMSTMVVRILPNLLQVPRSHVLRVFAVIGTTATRKQEGEQEEEEEESVRSELLLEWTGRFDQEIMSTWERDAVEALLRPSTTDVRALLAELRTMRDSDSNSVTPDDACRRVGDVVTLRTISNAESSSIPNALTLSASGGPGSLGDVIEVTEQAVEASQAVHSGNSPSDEIPAEEQERGQERSVCNILVRWRDTGLVTHHSYLLIPSGSGGTIPLPVMNLELWFRPRQTSEQGSERFLHIWAPLLTRTIRIQIEPIQQSGVTITQTTQATSAITAIAHLSLVPVYCATDIFAVKDFLPLIREVWSQHNIDNHENTGDKNFISKVDTELVLMAEKATKSTGSNKPPDVFSSIQINAEDINHYPALVQVALRRRTIKDGTGSDEEAEREPSDLCNAVMHCEALAERFALLQTVNGILSFALPYIDFERPQTPFRGKGVLASLASRCRTALFAWVKQPLLARALAAQAEEALAVKPEIVLSRSLSLKWAGGAAGENVDEEGRWTIFGQLFRKVHGLNPRFLRRPGQLWDTVFAGERAQDAGGPYRETWSALCADLMSPRLRLFCPSPNNVHKVGQNQDTFIFCPDYMHDSTHVEMLVFLGKLLGSAVRSKGYLDLYLAPAVWKLLVGQQLTLEDLRGIDVSSVNLLIRLRAIDEMHRRGGEIGKGEEAALAQLFQTGDMWCFTTVSKSGRGSVMELHPGGALENVTLDNLGRYCDELERFWLSAELQPAADAVRRGLCTQLPNSLLSLLRWDELEEMVCGRPDVDVSLLQSVAECTRGGCSQQRVQWLWEVLREDFSPDDRKAFVRFVWGRSRLPLTRQDFTQVFKIEAFRGANRTRRTHSDSISTSTSEDGYLPVSHTCFFSLELPEYSSREILKRRLLYAIHNCLTIDGDDTAASLRAAAMGVEV